MVNAFGEPRHGKKTIPVANKIITIINESNLDCAEIDELIDMLEHALEWQISATKPQLNIFAVKD